MFWLLALVWFGGLIEQRQAFAGSWLSLAGFLGLSGSLLFSLWLSLAISGSVPRWRDGTNSSCLLLQKLQFVLKVKILPDDPSHRVLE